MLTTLVAAKPRWSFWKCADQLRFDGHRWYPKRLWRVYRRLRLCSLGNRLPCCPRPMGSGRWTLCMSDTLDGARRFRALTMLDGGVREGLTVEIDTSLPALRIIRVLEHVAASRGLPQALRVDNGPALLAEAFITWGTARRIALRYIQPGKPAQKARIERFNRTYRTEVLDVSVCE